MTDRNAVRRGYDALAEDYQRARGKTPREDELLDELGTRLPTDSRILDAGCGDGRPTFTWFPPERDVVGLDFSQSQLELARARFPAASLTKGDMTTLPFEADSFDAVCAFSSFIHIPREEHETVLREFARVLRPGGWLLFSTGCDEWAGRNPDWLESGVAMEWDIRRLDATLELLAETGYTVEETWVLADELNDGNDDSAFPFVLARLDQS